MCGGRCCRAIEQLRAHVAEQAHKSGGAGAGKHTQKHSSNVVVSLQTKLRTMSSRFKAVLERRTRNLKSAQQRRGQFSSTPSSSQMAGQECAARRVGALLHRDRHDDPVYSSPHIYPTALRCDADAGIGTPAILNRRPLPRHTHPVLVVCTLCC